VLKHAASVKMHASAVLVSALGVMLACVALSFMSPGGSALSARYVHCVKVNNLLIEQFYYVIKF
jgi:hypothetical protein